MKPKKDAGNPRSSDGFARLQKGLTGERELVGVSYMDDPELLRVYLDYYWPVSRAQASHVLKAAPSAFLRIIDVGSGPGPVAAALIDSGATEAVLVDQSRRALDLALSELPKRCPPASIKTVQADIAVPDPETIPLWGSADCVSFGHSLNELFAGEAGRIEKRADLLGRYAEALVPGGFLLVIEPALLSTSRDLLAVRNLLVDRGWTVSAPCPGRSRLPCPALEAGDSHTCHEEIDWTPPPSVASLARTLNVDKESLKMTWFIFVPPAEASVSGSSGAAGDNGSEGRVSNNGREDVSCAADAEGSEVRERSEDVSCAEGEMAGREYLRVVSDPMLNKGGRVRRLVCGREGRFPLSVAKDSPDVARSGFDRLKRGDYICVENPELRENGWGIGSATRIKKIEGMRTGD